jgi:aryl-alcohol dehydrogenase-like predicted oxidoreductase
MPLDPPMQRRPLGPDAPPVFPVGFGGMPLSESERPDEAQAIRVLHAVLDAGVTLIDTSDVYGRIDEEVGHNERLVAKALRAWSGKDGEIVVATKGGRWREDRKWRIDGRPAQLRLACERSLRALGVERIGLYQLNAPDPDVPLEESVGALADLRAEGKIRWVGISNVDVGQIESARSIVPVASVQNRFNPFFRESLADGVVAHCAREGIGFLAYHPVGGWLARELGAHGVLRRIGRRHGVSPYAVAIAWELAQGATVIPIPGARTVEHALDSLSGARVPLSAEEVKAIDDATFSRKHLLRRRVRAGVGRVIRSLLGR